MSSFARIVPASFLVVAIVDSSAGAQSSAAPKPPAVKPVKRAQRPNAPLSDEAALARVVSLYEGGKYADCAQALAKLFEPASGRVLSEPRVVEQARVYQAACWIGAGKPELADEPLRAAIRANPQMSAPDSLVFPAPVVERFIQVRETLLSEIRAAEAERVKKAREAAARSEQRIERERARIRELEELASNETLITKNSRWLALAPFGIGQFQNRDKGLGWVFLAGELTLLSAAVTATVVVSHLNLKATEADKLESPSQVDNKLKAWHGVFVASSYGFLAMTAAGIAQAELAFVPEFREVRQRPLPAHLRATTGNNLSFVPDFSLERGGVRLGVSGRF